MAGTDKHYLATGYRNWSIDPSRNIFNQWQSEVVKAIQCLTNPSRKALGEGRNTQDDDVQVYSRDYTLAKYTPPTYLPTGLFSRLIPA